MKNHQQESVKKVRKGGSSRRAENDQWSALNRGNGDPRKSRAQVVCKFSVNGTCWHGEAGIGCRFGHPRPHAGCAQSARPKHSDRNKQGHTTRTHHLHPGHITCHVHPESIRMPCALPRRGDSVWMQYGLQQPNKSFLDMAQRIVGQLTWLHRIQNQIHAHQHSRPPQTRDPGRSPMTSTRMPQRGPLLTPKCHTSAAAKCQRPGETHRQ